MKKYALILAASLISTMAFAQIVPNNITSGEVEFLNSAPSMSGEIDIALPFDPLEVENNEPTFPPYSLNSATYVQTGPASIIAFMLIALLAAGIYNYHVRTQKD
ncbi:hypothetical protein KBB89_02240 [Candidatus Gracilibacteria bacterium]|nr:hypothetical protein [Candidatus Gracilibacteria bacterium]